MTGLYLGDVAFESFEVPDQIGFGGAHRLAVHKLIGGARVIDTLGRDDQALSWAGVLSGSNAAGRARSLDAIRVAGGVESLSWDAFCYSVIVSKLQFQFCSPWWIPYEISCVVQADLAQGAVAVTPSAIQTVTSDLSVAGGLLGPAFSDAISSASSLAVTGAAGRLAALAILSSAQSQVSGLLDGGRTEIESDVLTTIVAAAGSMANLTCGSGYLARSVANLGSSGF